MISVPFLSCAHSRTTRPERFRRRPRYLGGVLAAVAAAGLPACDVDVQSLRVVGVYVPGETQEPIMPETATAGVPKEIAIWTVGTCTTAGDIEVRYSLGGRLAEVTPYDYENLRGNCPDRLRHLEHKANLVFDEPGTAHVVFRYSTMRCGWPPEFRPPDRQETYIVQVSPAG